LKKYKGDPNNIFIADGYYTTTLVYQCMLQNVPSLDFGVEFANKLGIVKPDLVVYLDVNPKTAMVRKNAEEGKEKKDIFESDLEKQKKIREAFLTLAKNNVWCDWDQVDGNGGILEVRDLVLSVITDKFGF
jgi:thymidylate kinase